MGGDATVINTKKLKEFSPSKRIILAVCVRNSFASHKSKCTKQTEYTNISKDSNINDGNWLKGICLTLNFVVYCESIVKQNIFVCAYDLQQSFNLNIQYDTVTIFTSDSKI